MGNHSQQENNRTRAYMNSDNMELAVEMSGKVPRYLTISTILAIFAISLRRCLLATTLDALCKSTINTLELFPFTNVALSQAIFFSSSKQIQNFGRKHVQEISDIPETTLVYKALLSQLAKFKQTYSKNRKTTTMDLHA